MLLRLRGWGDTDVLVLLSLFRKHLQYYVYASDAQFAEVMRAELPGAAEQLYEYFNANIGYHKAASEILEMVRMLMEQFGLGLSTKNFRTDVIVTNGQEVYVYEHIYESIRQLPENRAGGVWLPDELSRFLKKAKQYRRRFTDSQEKYFQQVQLWGKSIAETKSKFYALREIFMREKRRSRQPTGVGAKRLALLKDIFTNVPPAHQAEKVVEVPSKAPKMWSSEEMETLVDFVVRITAQIQTTGSSDLVNHVAESLHRTEGSCVTKLSDMRDKFLKKSTTVRAAKLPDTIFDPTSEAYKVFSADWTDNNDPYALGILAIKSRCLRLNSGRNRKRRRKNIWAPRPKVRVANRAARGTTSANSMNPSAGAALLATFKSVASEPRINETDAVPQSLPSERTPASALSANDYAMFVKEIAEQCQWTEAVVHNVLRCMQHSINLYRSNKLVDFFYKIASLAPCVTFQDLFANAQNILTQFKQRFGTLNGFENLALTAPGINSPLAATDQETKEEACVTGSEVNATLTPINVNNQNRLSEEDTNHSCSFGEAIVDEDERGLHPPPVEPIAPYTSQNDNDNVGVRGDERAHEQPLLVPPTWSTQTGNPDDGGVEHGHEQSSLLESPTLTPQTGNEDGADDYCSSTAEKQSSPEDIWDDGVDADADLDDDNVDSQSVGSSDNAWSGSSNFSNTKHSHHHLKGNLPLLNPLSGQFAFGNSKKPSKRGKDEQYGKSFDLAKKRRLNDSKEDEDDEDDEDREDEGYDEREDDGEGHSDDADDEPLADIDSLSSGGELEETPHSLQSILDSLDSHMVELQEKQRILIERKEDREWRQRQYADREYGVQMSVRAFAPKR